jgi:anti-sigma B factor antagonist
MATTDHAAPPAGGDDAPQLTVSVAKPMIDGALVEIVGELDIATAELLGSRLHQLITCGSPRLALDLSGLRFCDSTGLRTLLGARREAEAEGGMLRLVNPQPIVAKALAVTGLNRVLDIVDGPLPGTEGDVGRSGSATEDPVDADAADPDV